MLPTIKVFNAMTDLPIFQTSLPESILGCRNITPGGRRGFSPSPKEDGRRRRGKNCTAEVENGVIK